MDPLVRAFLPVLWLGLAALLVLLVVAVCKLAAQRRRYKKLARLGIESIDELNGRDFERLLSQVFKEMGEKVVLTPAMNDSGADIVTEKDGVRTVVQAKRWIGKVGVKAVQEVVASKAVYKAANAMVVTNSTFTKAAIELARVNKVELWDRDKLIERLLALNPSVE